jgi:pimeloyl-ACP methyl ester carboxylesterase
MAGVTAGVARGDCGGGMLETMPVLDGRGQFGPRVGTCWTGVVLVIVVAFTMLWCNCAVAADTRVILLRGWFGVFSTGLDSLADELKAKGIKAEVAGHLYWSTAVADIVRERAAGKIGPIVLIGHSQGANNVIDAARSLQAHNIPVDLLVTLAPLLQYPVPANVARAINYYQSPGWGAPIAGDANFHGKLLNIDVAGDPSIFHITIDKSARIHAEILREITALSQSKQ